VKKSAGILLYKKEKDEIYVLLTHFGGPYWEKQEEGAWSLQKGLVEEKESVFAAAKRETQEETNLTLENEITYLGTKKVSKHKLVIMFMSSFTGDISCFKSNTFQLEWPKNSGKIKEYPEMDKISWFTLREAKKYINKTQTYFLDKLEEKLKNI